MKVTKFFLKSLDDDAENEEKQADPKRAKLAQAKKTAKKSRSTGTKKSKKEKVEDEEEYGEVYFVSSGRYVRLILIVRNGSENDKNALHISRLEGYQVEKEDVFVI